MFDIDSVADAAKRELDAEMANEVKNKLKDKLKAIRVAQRTLENLESEYQEILREARELAH